MSLPRWLLRLIPALASRKRTGSPVVAVPCVHGVVTHRNSDTELRGVAALGVRHVRTTYYARESAEVNAAWPQKLATMDALGIEPLMILHDFDQDVDVIHRVVRQFPERLWQIGNEANAYPHYWLGEPAQYARLMRELMAAHPTTRFVGMGLAFNYAQAGYLKAYLAAGGPMLAAWCIHCYGAPISFAVPVRETQAVLQNRMPLWVTEYGIDRAQQEQAWGPRTLAQLDAEQADEIADVLRRAGPLGVSRTYQYCYYDGTDDGFGLVRADESLRPSAVVFSSTL